MAILSLSLSLSWYLNRGTSTRYLNQVPQPTGGHRWSWHSQLGGVGWEGQGMGIETLQIGGSSKPDLLYMAYDNPSGANTFRYRIGSKLRSACSASLS